MKQYQFKQNHYYHYGNLERFGFEAVVQCVKRVNHKNGSVSLKFIITDLKIHNYNISARTFISCMRDNLTQWMEDSNYESINDWYFTLDAENEVSGPKIGD